MAAHYGHVSLGSWSFQGVFVGSAWCGAFVPAGDCGAGCCDHSLVADPGEQRNISGIDCSDHGFLLQPHRRTREFDARRFGTWGNR